MQEHTAGSCVMCQYQHHHRVRIIHQLRAFRSRNSRPPLDDRIVYSLIALACLVGDGALIRCRLNHDTANLAALLHGPGGTEASLNTIDYAIEAYRGTAVTSGLYLLLNLGDHTSKIQ
jgi:hypothetical protein